VSGGVRVATFNIHHGAPEGGRVDHDALVETCASLDADVLGLQEVESRHRRSWFRHQAALVARRLGYAFVYGPVIRSWPLGRYGNALLARGPIRDVELLPLARPSPRQPRGAILARVESPGLDVTVAVTHLQHHGKQFADRPPEAPVQLDGLLDALSARASPRVLLGDLNLGAPRAVPILTAAGYTVAPTPATFPADRPRLVLDYIAFAGLRLVGCEVVATLASDHRAVVASLSPLEPVTDPRRPRRP
jgi:endonuclease/exonuclease/phosphatase family metal-dependent hydrolase